MAGLYDALFDLTVCRSTIHRGRSQITQIDRHGAILIFTSSI